MNATDYAVLEAIHVSWAANDLRATVRCFAEDIEFAVNAPDGAASFVGTGRGRDALSHRLSDFLDKYEVLRLRRCRSPNATTVWPVACSTTTVTGKRGWRSTAACACCGPSPATRRPH